MQMSLVEIDVLIDKYVADGKITVDLRKSCQFKDFAELPHNHNGVYILYQLVTPTLFEILYVGKGKIKTRQKKHRQKLIETPQKTDPLAWRWFRNKRGFDYNNLHLIALFFNDKSGMTCLESNLIRHMDPMLNNETFKGDLR
jgi:hypothetical protein